MNTVSEILSSAFHTTVGAVNDVVGTILPTTPFHIRLGDWNGEPHQRQIFTYNGKGEGRLTYMTGEEGERKHTTAVSSFPANVIESIAKAPSTLLGGRMYSARMYDSESDSDSGSESESDMEGGENTFTENKMEGGAIVEKSEKNRLNPSLIKKLKLKIGSKFFGIYEHYDTDEYIDEYTFLGFYNEEKDDQDSNASSFRSTFEENDDIMLQEHETNFRYSDCLHDNLWGSGSGCDGIFVVTKKGSMMSEKKEKKDREEKKERGCEPQTQKKYTSRASPPYPANECCGLKKHGNDGRPWLSKRDKNGICKWIPDPEYKAMVKGEDKIIKKAAKLEKEGKLEKRSDLLEKEFKKVGFGLKKQKKNTGESPEVLKLAGKVIGVAENAAAAAAKAGSETAGNVLEAVGTAAATAVKEAVEVVETVGELAMKPLVAAASAAGVATKVVAKQAKKILAGVGTPAKLLGPKSKMKQGKNNAEKEAKEIHEWMMKHK